MSKAVIISIKPKWVELIASGQKTVEVRRTRPKIDVPFKCYIYCTKSDGWYGVQSKANPAKRTNAAGKVVGEFVCDRIYDINYILDNDTGYGGFDIDYPYGADCLTVDELEKYLVERLWIPYSQSIVVGYGWHISNLKMYDKPKQIQDFYRIGVESCRKCDICWYHDYSIDEEPCVSCHSDRDYVWRAPQSWCYVEELE